MKSKKRYEFLAVSLCGTGFFAGAFSVSGIMILDYLFFNSVSILRVTTTFMTALILFTFYIAAYFYYKSKFVIRISRRP